MDEHLLWKDGETNLVLHTPIFDVEHIERSSSDGRTGTFIRLQAKPWATIVPLLWREDGVPVFLMVDQFRHGSGTVTREFPAGLVECGEDPIEGGRRELLEETGYDGQVSVLGTIWPNPAFASNRHTFLFAENLKKVSDQKLDEDEQIDLVQVPVEEVIREMGTGKYANSVVAIGVSFFLRLREERPELKGRK